MNAQFKKGALELCVLVCIAEKDQYGYELSQNISRYMAIAEGTLYPLLRRLTKEEYLETYMAPSSEGPARKYYTLSKLGFMRMKLLLAEWDQFTASVNQIIDAARGGER
ncbi:PadR family transcriptional regulator [Bacillus halotolerans]|uniref:PadR family transcriptional regulator n=1 Tax=Bacillus halotolerans TaxID=260554 RepID=UPI000BFEB66B|nr:PadR family transcriptional regulator [Bacillus halotolerans]MDG3074551.1 PadR family transcriptional regulator [Bacillus halotolerans]PHI50371.1 PadR family transcriptional regulator [Bacillus halotolerans]